MAVKVLSGVNDLPTTHPTLCLEWSPINIDNADQYTAGSGKKKYWTSQKCRHTWEASIKNRATKGSGCPYCSGHKVLAGFNDLATTHPKLAKEWSSDNDYGPEKVSAGSQKKALWVCQSGHSWESKISHRAGAAQSGCPVCKNKAVIPGLNDLETFNPQIASLIVGGVDPRTVVPGSHKTARWACPRGHEWEASISSVAIHGWGCPYCSNHRVLEGFNDLETTHPDVFSEWSTRNTVSAKTITKGSDYYAWWKCEKGHEWQCHVYSRTGPGQAGCKKCTYTGVSKLEETVCEFLQTLNIPYEKNNKTILKDREVDFYFPDQKIAIEVNGVFWHSEAFKQDTHYHYKKWLDCKKQGIQLITIWEDDWNTRNSVVKNMIKHKLGQSNRISIGARKTQIKSIEYKEASVFLTKHHIQGKARGSKYLGLTHNNELVAVAVFLTNETETTLTRFAASAQVPGALSKLIKHSGFKTLTTFADLCVSDGSLYESTGWHATGFVQPDYKYLRGNVRSHKFNYRISRFKEDPSLDFIEGYTEIELARLNKLWRVWDCGKMKYSITL